MSQTTAEYVFNVRSCALCGADHDNLTFKRMYVPVYTDAGVMTHWASCPTNGDPILFGVVPTPSEQPSGIAPDYADSAE